jgi:hypothetical protein
MSRLAEKAKAAQILKAEFEADDNLDPLTDFEIAQSAIVVKTPSSLKEGLGACAERNWCESDIPSGPRCLYWKRLLPTLHSYGRGSRSLSILTGKDRAWLSWATICFSRLRLRFLEVADCLFDAIDGSYVRRQQHNRKGSSFVARCSGLSWKISSLHEEKRDKELYTTRFACD